jgi:hypothetical protein
MSRRQIDICNDQDVGRWGGDVDVPSDHLRKLLVKSSIPIEVEIGGSHLLLLRRVSSEIAPLARGGYLSWSNSFDIKLFTAGNTPL